MGTTPLTPTLSPRSGGRGGISSYLVYCHPGFPDAGLAAFDTLIEPRAAEYAFLAGADWPAENITLTEWP